MTNINNHLPVGLYLPLWNASDPHYTTLRILPEESKVLNSKEKVPYIVVFEILRSDARSSTKDLQQVAQSYVAIIDEIKGDLNNDNHQPEDVDPKQFASLYFVHFPLLNLIIIRL